MELIQGRDIYSEALSGGGDKPVVLTVGVIVRLRKKEGPRLELSA